jgi:hypothetical protein
MYCVGQCTFSICYQWQFVRKVTSSVTAKLLQVDIRLRTQGADPPPLPVGAAKAGRKSNEQVKYPFPPHRDRRAISSNLSLAAPLRLC